MGKIKPVSFPKRETDIKVSTLLHPDTINFSFKYLDFSNPKFQIDHLNGIYLKKFFERIKNISSMTMPTILSNRSKALRAHPITWCDTTEPDGFNCLNEQLQCLDGYQFSIEKEKYGRIHGIILENYFFVIWLDPDHKLYG